MLIVYVITVEQTYLQQHLLSVNNRFYSGKPKVFDCKVLKYLVRVRKSVLISL